MMIFSALADPTRFRIVEMLALNGRMPATQISQKFSTSAPAISQHLKVLKEAHLVSVEINAQQRIYRLNPEGIAEIEHWIGKLRQIWESKFDALDAHLKQELKKTQFSNKERKK